MYSLGVLMGEEWVQKLVKVGQQAGLDLPKKPNWLHKTYFNRPVGLFSVFGLYYVCLSVRIFGNSYMWVCVCTCGCMWVH